MESTFYQQLIQKATFGYAHHRVLRSPQTGEVVDFIFLEVNAAFERLTGLQAKNIVGSPVSEVLKGWGEAGIEWLDCYWEVALQGSVEEFEQFSPVLHRWYRVQVSAQSSDSFTALFTDITEQKALEREREQTNARVQRQRAAVVELLLNESIATGESPTAPRLITRLLADTLEASRASVWLFSDDESELICRAQYDADTSEHSSGMILKSSDFPMYFHALRTDTRIFTEDARQDARTNEFNRTYHEPFGITALLDCGIVVNGQLIGVVCIEHRGKPRKWQVDEESFARTATTIVAQSLMSAYRKHAEREMQISEQRFRDVVESMVGGVYEIDSTGNIIYASQQVMDILGLQAEAAIGKRPIGLVLPEDLHLMKEAVAHSISNNIPMRNIEHRIIRQDTGEIRWISVSGAPITAADGTIVGMRGTVEDISARRAGEEEKERRQAAEAASRAKSEFLANMSHEIRTPLNAVIGFTDLLKTTPLSPTQQQYVHNANTSAHSLLAIINDILDFSKIEAGKLELDIMRSDLIELIEQTADIVKYSANQKGLELLLNLPPNLPRYAQVDPVRLRQILVNLLSNAVKFTQAGEVELAVQAHTEGEFTRLHFSVRDTGIGISEEQQRRLFKAFMQADSSTTRRFGGTGLGLAISNMLAQKMGTAIQVSSKEEQGSVFSFYLTTRCEHGESDHNESLQHLRRVLLIDDNANNRLILSHLLQYWGIRSEEAESGKQAIENLQRHSNNHYQAILLDYQMPHIDGLQALRLMREQFPLLPPIIFLHSSAEDEQTLHAARELHISCRLAKPVKIEDLRRCLLRLHNTTTPINSYFTPIYTPSAKPLFLDLADLEPLILVAEDVAINRLLLRKIIAQIIPKARIVEAQDGNETLEKYKESPPDLVLMDVQMPQLDGYAATLRIRQMSLPQSPIIALTAGVMESDRLRCLQVGMNDFLSKPIDKEALVAALRKYLLPA